MPTFDVVVPCYNYARFLERSVKSALNQEGADVRVLIIDDCSSDDSALVAQKLCEEDSRVEFRRHEANQGHISTYNEGLIGWAKGDYCVLLSADDAIAPGAFKRALKIFESSEDVGLVYGRGRIITHDDEFQFPENNDFTSTQILSGNEFLRLVCEKCTNPVPTPTAIVRTDWQHRLGGYRRDLPHTGDMEMWMRFARNGSVGVVHSVQAEYRLHGRNMSTQYFAQVLSDRNEFELTCLEVLGPIMDTNPNAHSWMQSMYAELLADAQRHAARAFDCADVEGYKAWSEFAAKTTAKLVSPRRSWRLTAREVLGQSSWRSLRKVRKIFNPSLPDPLPLGTVWPPKHGDVFGLVPATSAN